MLATLLALAAALPAAEPLALHPDNPHYLRFRGEPAVLVGSGEHYGAVLNRDFDHAPYLDELQRRGLNLTRTFSGTYRENPASFNIRDNTLAPAAGRYVAPWARSDTSGASDGHKFDLDRFDPDYLPRLKSFIADAGKRGIVVEYVLFCPMYDDGLWQINPMNAKNNVNGVGDVPREEVYTLDHPDLLGKQLAFVRWVVPELNEFDNVYFEICNEPYFGGVTLDWQRRVAATIVEAEEDLPNKHLIAQNIANNRAKINDPDPNVSIFNFHYAEPPAALENHGLNRALGDDETGFEGNGDRPYREEGWQFLLSGGSIYSNLDYSFTPQHEDGTAKVEPPTPGGGGVELRNQLSILKRFVEGFDFLRMAPQDGVIAIEGQAPEGARLSVLGEPGAQYAAYLVKGGDAEGTTKLRLTLPTGRYRCEWLDPKTGTTTDGGQVEAKEGDPPTVETPPFAQDIALKMTRA